MVKASRTFIAGKERETCTLISLTERSMFRNNKTAQKYQNNDDVSPSCKNLVTRRGGKCRSQKKLLGSPQPVSFVDFLLLLLDSNFREAVK